MYFGHAAHSVTPHIQPWCKMPGVLWAELDPLFCFALTFVFDVYTIATFTLAGCLLWPWPKDCAREIRCVEVLGKVPPYQRLVRFPPLFRGFMQIPRPAGPLRLLYQLSTFMLGFSLIHILRFFPDWPVHGALWEREGDRPALVSCGHGYLLLISPGL